MRHLNLLPGFLLLPMVLIYSIMITPLIQLFTVCNQVKNALGQFLGTLSLDEIITLLEKVNASLAGLTAEELVLALKALAKHMQEMQQLSVDEYSRYIVVGNPPDPAIWVPKKEVWDRLGIVRSTLDVKMAAGELVAYYKVGAERQKTPRVFFKRTDIEAHRATYSHDKGKTR
ncbi:hypothetical protein SAMN05216436_105242 [bacterium A37T11]|nr:hypothetical protein SAMN05216436_105242 [bacterium A37T11]